MNRRAGMPRPSKPMPKMSAKRREALGGNPSSTFAPKRPQLKTSATKQKPRQSTGPDRLTVDAVLERDQYSCVRCGCGVHGERGIGWSIHHRRPRRAGGDPRPETNLPANLVTLCGSGTTGCHGRIESQRAEALDKGWLLHAEEIPAKRQIKHATHGWCLLLDNARVRRIKDYEAHCA